MATRGTPSRREGPSVGKLGLAKATPTRRKKVPVEREYGAPRGAARSGGVREPTGRLSQQPDEAGGSRSRETTAKVGAASTTTGRVGTARRPGSGKQGGKAYERRNQWWNPLKRFHRLQPGGYGPGSSARPTMVSGDSLAVRIERREAMAKACGVTMARLQGKSWAPTPPTDQR